jgi:hypothetical protein
LAATIAAKRGHLSGKPALRRPSAVMRLISTGRGSCFAIVLGNRISGALVEQSAQPFPALFWATKEAAQSDVVADRKEKPVLFA